MPTEAYRFTVNTPTAKVVDLGTEFGVEVAENGATRATVFDGKIELYEMTETGSLGRSTTLVAEQQSRVSAQTVLSTVIEPVPTFHLYVRDMRDAVDHVTVTRGHAIYQNHAPASVHRYEDGLLTNQPVIFMEQQRVTVDQTLTRLISEPGWYRGRDMYSRAGRVESGQDVTSYLVHLDITDINGEPYEGNNPQTTHCTLRFPRPIVGLIVGTN
ncbi:MAG: FecR family protein, partial [Desulfobacterales bacterium]|nr:FecR family protein [Desulfobacterales bacterium]